MRKLPIRLFSALLLLVLITQINAAKAAIIPPGNSGWIVVSSRSTAESAIREAKKYARAFPTVVVFRSSNGYFGITLGWVDKRAGKSILNRLKSRGVVPGDSYIHNGKRWQRPVWSARNSHSNRDNLYASTRYDGFGSNVAGNHRGNNENTQTRKPHFIALDPALAEVHGLKRSGDSFLSLRKGPGTSYLEIARMRPGTQLTITGRTKKWYRVELGNGMKGFAFAKYVKFAEVPVLGPGNNDGSNPQDVAKADQNPTNEKDHSPQTSTETKADPQISQSDEAEHIDDQVRVALVLGNGRYEHTDPLANPANDANAMAAKLEGLGFIVIKGLDLDKAGMELAVRKFVRELEGADIALFFYAGHAMQVGGHNYLIPVNAQLDDATAIDFETINVDVILEFMNAPDRMSIALLDACRNNPLARTFRRKLKKTSARSAFVGRGLAVQSTGEGQTLIGFATAPGEVALDGTGDNSPFTTALLKHIGTPNLEIELMLKRVKADVFKATDGNQSPWQNSALRKEFYFAK